MNLEDIWNSILIFFEESGWRLIVFMLVLVVGVLLVRVLTLAIRRILLRGRMEKTLVGFIVAVARFALYIILVFVLAAVIGMDMTPLAAAISAVLVAIGLALQNSLANLANGLIIIGNQPFKEGDYVDIGSSSGTIKSIGLFVTELITPDGKRIVLTNTTVIEGPIVNYSARSLRRIDFFVNVEFDCDIEKARSALLEVSGKDARVCANPPSVVKVHEFGTSSIKLLLRLWVKNADYWDVFWDTNEAILYALRTSGIKIALSKVEVVSGKEEN